MKIKTSELICGPLDWAVTQCEGAIYHGPNWSKASTDWSLGGPIIERECIAISPTGTGEEPWRAEGVESEIHGGIIVATNVQVGPTPLVAAMRCYVASKLGNEVEVPDSLVQ